MYRRLCSFTNTHQAEPETGNVVSSETKMWRSCARTLWIKLNLGSRWMLSMARRVVLASVNRGCTKTSPQSPQLVRRIRHVHSLVSLFSSWMNWWTSSVKTATVPKDQNRNDHPAFSKVIKKGNFHDGTDKHGPSLPWASFAVPNSRCCCW